MPNRIIKESITTSTTLAGLSDAKERHFWRLLVQADDFGYLDARPEVIRARAYPMMLDRVTAASSEKHTEALVTTGLLHLFETDGKRYGHFPTWDDHQQKRAKYSKYPQVISCDINCNQLPAYAPETLDIRNETLETRHKTKEAQVKPAFVLPEWIEQKAWDDYLEMRRKKRATATESIKALVVEKLEKIRAGGDDPNDVLRKSTISSWTDVYALKGEGSTNGTARKDDPSTRPGRTRSYQGIGINFE